MLVLKVGWAAPPPPPNFQDRCHVLLVIKKTLMIKVQVGFISKYKKNRML